MTPVLAAAAVAGIVSLVVALGAVDRQPTLAPPASTPSSSTPESPSSSMPEGPSSSTPGGVVSAPLSYDDLAEALSAHDGQPGYGQVVVSPNRDEVILYWKGSPPRDVADLIAAGADGIRVRLVDAPFSSNEIRDASKRVWNEVVALYGPGVMASISGTRDLDGLIVRTTEPVDLEPLERVAGMPLRQERGEPGVLLDIPTD
jgi:hypothetical protein